MRERGHTLVELMVALCLLLVLASGLCGFLKASLGSLVHLGEALAAQRSLRLATAELTDEVQAMGFLVPCRSDFGPRYHLAVDRPLGQLEGRTLTQARSLGGVTDELTFLQDEPLPGRTLLVVSVPAGALPPCRLAMTSDHPGRLRPGDLLLVEDGRWEGARVLEEVDLVPRRVVEVPLEALGGEAGPVFGREHGAGAPLTLLRPRRLVQYRLVHLRRGQTLRPALARLETAWAGSFAPVDWPRALKEDGTVRIVAEHVTGFHVGLPGGEGVPVPPLVRITLEAQHGSGPRRTATFLGAPRNGPGGL